MNFPDQLPFHGAQLRVVRAWPKTPADVAFEVAGEDDRLVGRWFSDHRAAKNHAGRTSGALLSDDGYSVLQPGGADRKLPTLQTLVQRGAKLISHRPGKRAVVRVSDGKFRKVTRHRAVEQVHKHRILASTIHGYAHVPEVCALDDDQLELAALSGYTPLEAEAHWYESWLAVGRMLDALGRPNCPEVALELTLHDATAEAEVTVGWVRKAVACGRLPDADLHGVLQPLRAHPEPVSALGHRDLHDGQLLFGDGPVGVLDPDTLAWTEPALDLANLLVHLELREAQGLLSATRRIYAKQAILEGASPTAATLRRLPQYEAACRLRLAAVYAFRPTWHGLARQWYAQLVPPLSAVGV